MFVNLFFIFVMIRALNILQQRTEGVAILMNSHNLDQSRAVSTRLLGLHAGRIVLDSVPAAVTDADLARIYGGAESEAAP